MLRIETIDGTLLTVPSFKPRDLEAAAACLTVLDELLLKETLVMIIPFTYQSTRTIAIDAEIGPYAATMATQAISRKLGNRITLFRSQVDDTRRRVHQRLGLHGLPQRVIPYFASFYFPLGRSETGGTIWIAGHYLQDLTIIAPHVVRARFQTANKDNFTVTFSSPTLPDARRLSQLQEYAAEVTRELQPVLREQLGPVYNGAQFSTPLPKNYAHLNLNGNPLYTTTPIDPVREALALLWPKVVASLKAEGLDTDYSALYADVTERIRTYR